MTKVLFLLYCLISWSQIVSVSIVDKLDPCLGASLLFVGLSDGTAYFRYTTLDFEDSMFRGVNFSIDCTTNRVWATSETRALSLLMFCQNFGIGL